MKLITSLHFMYKNNTMEPLHVTGHSHHGHKKKKKKKKKQTNNAPNKKKKKTSSQEMNWLARGMTFMTGVRFAWNSEHGANVIGGFGLVLFNLVLFVMSTIEISVGPPSGITPLTWWYLYLCYLGVASVAWVVFTGLFLKSDFMVFNRNFYGTASRFYTACFFFAVIHFVQIQIYNDVYSKELPGAESERGHTIWEKTLYYRQMHSLTAGGCVVCLVLALGNYVGEYATTKDQSSSFSSSETYGSAKPREEHTYASNGTHADTRIPVTDSEDEDQSDPDD
jgi:hypothetical protein